MGVNIAVTFPMGRYHASAAGLAPNAGVVEWPPSAWRIMRALYSAWKTRCDDLDPLVVEQLLQKLSATLPEYYVDRRTGSGSTSHAMHPGNAVYDSKTMVYDTFITCVRNQPALYVRWPDVLLGAEAREALGRLCASLTWLGRAESLADVELRDCAAGEDSNAFALVPEAKAGLDIGTMALLVPTDKFHVDDLVGMPSDLRRKKANLKVVPPGARFHSYSIPAPEHRTARPAIRRTPREATAIRFEVVPLPERRSPSRLALTDAVIHTAALRQAVMAQFGRSHGGTDSPTLSGHSLLEGEHGGGPLRGHIHTHYLALPDHQITFGGRWISQFLLWAPGGFTREEIGAARTVRIVRGFDWITGSVPFAVIANGVGDPNDLAPELCRPSMRWRTVTPVVAGRYPNAHRTWEQQVRLDLLADWRVRMESAGVETDVQPAITLQSWDGKRFATTRPRSRRLPRSKPRPQFHCHLEISQEVQWMQPLCLGAGSHFGLGLFVPDPQR